MGMFDMFEAALEQGINDTVAAQVTISTRLIDERVTALESGKVQSTFTGDVANALTDDQREAVARIITEAVPGEVDTAISNGSGESAIESAIETYMEYNLDMDSHIQNWMDYNFDIEEKVQEALDNNIDFDNVKDDLSGLTNKVEDLEPLADSMDRLSDEFSVMRETVEGLDPANTDAIDEINGRLTALEVTVADIEEAIRSFGTSV